MNDEGKFVADFIASNIENIWNIGKNTFVKFDETIKVKLKLAYRTYLLAVRDKYSKSKSFFIRNQPLDLYDYYVPTGIICEKTHLPFPTFDNCINFSNHLIITGTGGCGKTILMKHLFLDCIKNKKYTPIIVELREINTNKNSLDDLIINTLDNFGFNISGEYISKAKEAGHFSFFLDGFDEVNYPLRSNLIKEIKNISNKYSKCPVFISSRPDDTFNGLNNFSVFRVLPLELKSAIALISKLPYDEEIKEKFTKALKSGLFNQHRSFLSNPLLLSIMLLTYGENAEIPSKLSIFYNQAYEALFQRHDAKKGGYNRSRLTSLDIQDFARVFSLFSLQTYEKRFFKMPKIDCLKFIDKSKQSINVGYEPEDYLKDLLSAACLLVEDGLEIAYSHRSFQEYFVALYLSSASEELQIKLIERYWKNISSDRVIHLLLEINPELVERLLFIPKLDFLFSKLGVNKKVGITHAAKYIKNTFKQVEVSDLGVVALYSDHEISFNLHLLVKMIVAHCQAFMFPEELFYKNYRKNMNIKYGGNNKKIKYKTKELTYKSPLLRDLLNESKSVLSTAYLQATFSAYKKLKKKHDNRLENLDKLLGI